MKPMKIFLFAILLLFSQVAIGQTLPITPGSSNYQLPNSFSFTPPSTDASVNYLSVIFGVVDGVLHGTGSQILGTMFGIMNSAVLTIGGVIVMYVLVVSTLNTAHEGEVMGREWSSIWIPVRVVIGIGAMLPKATGYSFIQILVMWLVVQGVGAADSVWAAATQYIQRGGVVVEQNSNLNGANANTKATTANVPLVTLAGNVLKAETCMNVLYNSLVNQNANAPSSGSSESVPSFVASLLVTGTPSNNTPPCYAGDSRPGCTAQGDTGGAISFPGNVSFAGKNYQGACGSVTWDFTSDADKVSNPSNLGAYDSRSIAVQQIVMDMEPLANTLAQMILPTSNSQTASNISLTNLTPGTLMDAAEDYMGIMGPYFDTANSQELATLQTYFTQAQAYGWMSAGSFYFVLASLNNSFQAAETKFPQMNIPASFDSSYFNQAALNALNGNVTPAAVSCPSSGGGADALDTFVCNDYNLALGQAAAASGGKALNVPSIAEVQPLWQGKVAGVSGKWVSSVINAIPGRFDALVAPLNNLVTAQDQSGLNGDPLIQISNLGYQIIDTIEYIWLGGTAAVFLLAFVGGLCSSSLGTAITGAMTWFVTLFMTVMFTMFVAGAIMEFYVPLIPFILFLSAIIGWFIAVIESMVAAPLVALGLIIPDGHKHFGQAKNALMLMLNVFIRPTLIIFGFIAGSILSHVALWILNQGLAFTLTTSKGVAVRPDLTHILEIVALVVIYVGLVVTIINKSFSLIYELPAQVLQWIGGQGRQFGEGQFGQEIRGQFGEAAGQVSGRMQETSKGVGEQTSAMAKGYKEDAKKSASMGGDAGIS